MDVIDYLDHKCDPTWSQTPCSRSISVRVLQEELWDKFNKKTTEMIVTKAGRRMFPVIKLEIQGLDPFSMYLVIIEFVQVGDYRWKFINNEWVQGSKSEAKSQSRYCFYTHPESPNYGSHWMKKEIEFPKVKLTNRTPPEEGQVVLNSLHKYEPKVHVIKSNPGQEKETICFRLPQTQFIAVTAYQNESITELKIKNNPYAKAFAEKSKKKGVSAYEANPFFDTISYQQQLQHQQLQQQYQQPPQPVHPQPQHQQQPFFYNCFQNQNSGCNNFYD
ncbi:T-box transcription factor T homolog 1-like [Panonychus citri]|uniref:T-box transcription factor T homolog 1-like n=1 Tax=Panonychus citri TaxID=50023 RepID=UPI0023080234|nr:T-box transcription factor T homolog 1-like [Panonychus citri]